MRRHGLRCFRVVGETEGTRRAERTQRRADATTTAYNEQVLKLTDSQWWAIWLTVGLLGVAWILDPTSRVTGEPIPVPFWARVLTVAVPVALLRLWQKRSQ